jgi:SET domain-containing protein
MLLRVASCALAVADPSVALHELRLARISLLADAAGAAVRPSPGKGLGAFATRSISRHSRMGDYTGEVLTQRQLDARYGSQDGCTAEEEAWAVRRRRLGIGLTGDYVFRVGEDRHGNVVFIDAEDETAGGSWTRYLNHDSAAPNLEARAIPVSMDGEPRVWFFANRAIEVDEELCYDYGSDYVW